MKYFFLVWLLLYLLHALYTNIYRESPAPGRFSYLTATIQFPLVIFAYYYGFIYEAISLGQLSLLLIGAGIICGHILFGFSVFAIHGNFRDSLAHMADLSGLWNFIKANPETLTRLIGISLVEEMIYRVAAQQIFIDWSGSPAFSILLVAGLFALVHWHFFRNPLMQSAEFVVFSAALGVIFYFSGSLMLVLCIHTMRNLEIEYIDYLRMQDEEEAPKGAAPGIADLFITRQESTPA